MGGVAIRFRKHSEQSRRSFIGPEKGTAVQARLAQLPHLVGDSSKGTAFHAVRGKRLNVAEPRPPHLRKEARAAAAATRDRKDKKMASYFLL